MLGADASRCPQTAVHGADPVGNSANEQHGPTSVSIADFGSLPSSNGGDSPATAAEISSYQCHTELAKSIQRDA